MSIRTGRLVESAVLFLLTGAIVVALISWEEPTGPAGLLIQIAIFLVLFASACLVARIIAIALHRLVSGITRQP